MTLSNVVTRKTFCTMVHFINKLKRLNDKKGNYYNICCILLLNTDSARNYLGYSIAVGPSADVQFGTRYFDPRTLPYICANVTTLFSFPESRNIICTT